jgi:hypothetical protein
MMLQDRNRYRSKRGGKRRIRSSFLSRTHSDDQAYFIAGRDLRIGAGQSSTPE